MLRAVYNEIIWNLVNYRMSFVARTLRRWTIEGENKNTKWENSRNRYGYMILYIWEKQLLVSERNNAM